MSANTKLAISERIYAMKKPLAASMFVIAFISTASTHADEAASSQTCGCPQPKKHVFVPRPPPKIGDSVQEISVYCGSDINTRSPNTSAKTTIPPEDSSVILRELLEALAKLFAALAWPVAAVFIVRQLRTEITGLLSRLKRGKVGGAEFEFADYVRAAEEEAEIQRTPETQAVDSIAVAKASSDPRGTILSAWLDVEAALNSLVETKKLAEGYTRIAKRNLTSIRLVQRAELLSANYVGLFHDLRAMRNEAAHSTDFLPPADAVVRYVQLAQELAAELHKIAAPPNDNG